MDNELFELCKEVYEKTGWKYTESGFDFIAITKNNNGEEVYRIMYSQNKTMPHWDKIPVFPLYTSDYLLEKLLPVCYSIQIYRRKTGLIDLMWMPQKPMYNNNVVSDTPLKALLKLTIALHEEGEL